MKKKVFKKVLMGSLAALLMTGSMNIQAQMVKAETLQREDLEDDEVYVKGENGHYFILNTNYSIYTAQAFSKVVHDRVGEYVKIWDVENNLKEELNNIRKQRLNHPEQYHLMTNEERNEFVNAAKKQNMSLKQYLEDCGIDLSNAPKHLTTAWGGPNRIWHYGDVELIKAEGNMYLARRLYFEKFDMINNHFDNTMIGFIHCPTEDRDRFVIPTEPSDNWKFLFTGDDHYNEFKKLDYLMLYVKN